MRRWIGLLVAALPLLVLGFLLDAGGICPIVKRVWTPAFVLYSGGWCLLTLAGFYGVVELLGWRGWATPLMVFGSNSLLAYLMSYLLEPPLAALLARGLSGPLGQLPPGLDRLVVGSLIVIGFGCLLWELRRRRLFLRL